MAGEAEYNVDPEMLDEMHGEQLEDSELDRMELGKEYQEGYEEPQADERQNQHSFLHKAAFDAGDTVKTTFLTQEELGRPLFSVRFLLKLKTIARHYIDPLCTELELDPHKDNKIAIYFQDETENISSSGMSNEGFAMNLNVTKKMDAVRRRIRDPIENLKGGKK